MPRDSRIRRALISPALAVLLVVAWTLPAIAARATPRPHSVPHWWSVRAVAIGDSVMEGAQWPLTGRGVVVYAGKSWAFIHGISVADNLRASGRLARTVVIHLGTNGPITNALFDEMMQALRGVPHVIFLTVKEPRYWESEVNATIWAGARRWHRVRVVDWHRLATLNPGWLYDDGIHLTPIGGRRYAQIVSAAIH